MLFLGLLTSNVRYITTNLYFTPTRGIKEKHSKNSSPSSTEERKTPVRDREDQSSHRTQNENSNLSESANTAPTTQFPPGTQNETSLNPPQNSFVNSLGDQGTNQMNSSAQIFEYRPGTGHLSTNYINSNFGSVNNSAGREHGDRLNSAQSDISPAQSLFRNQPTGNTNPNFGRVNNYVGREHEDRLNSEPANIFFDLSPTQSLFSNQPTGNINPNLGSVNNSAGQEHVGMLNSEPANIFVSPNINIFDFSSGQSWFSNQLIDNINLSFGSVNNSAGREHRDRLNSEPSSTIFELSPTQSLFSNQPTGNTNPNLGSVSNSAGPEHGGMLNSELSSTFFGLSPAQSPFRNQPTGNINSNFGSSNNSAGWEHGGMLNSEQSNILFNFSPAQSWFSNPLTDNTNPSFGSANTYVRWEYGDMPNRAQSDISVARPPMGHQLSNNINFDSSSLDDYLAEDALGWSNNEPSDITTRIVSGLRDGVNNTLENDLPTGINYFNEFQGSSLLDRANHVDLQNNVLFPDHVFSPTNSSYNSLERPNDHHGTDESTCWASKTRLGDNIKKYYPENYEQPKQAEECGSGLNNPAYKLTKKETLDYDNLTTNDYDILNQQSNSHLHNRMFGTPLSPINETSHEARSIESLTNKSGENGSQRRSSLHDVHAEQSVDDITGQLNRSANNDISLGENASSFDAIATPPRTPNETLLHEVCDNIVDESPWNTFINYLAHADTYTYMPYVILGVVSIFGGTALMRFAFRFFYNRIFNRTVVSTPIIIRNTPNNSTTLSSYTRIIFNPLLQMRGWFARHIYRMMPTESRNISLLAWLVGTGSVSLIFYFSRERLSTVLLKILSKWTKFK